MMRRFIYISMYLSVYLGGPISTHVSIGFMMECFSYLSIYLYTYLHIYLFIYISWYLSYGCSGRALRGPHGLSDCLADCLAGWQLAGWQPACLAAWLAGSWLADSPPSEHENSRFKKKQKTSKIQTPARPLLNFLFFLFAYRVAKGLPGAVQQLEG